MKKKYNIPFISGVSEIVDHYDAFIIDIWGVVHNGVHLNSGAENCLKKIIEEEKIFVFVSNSSFRSKEVETDLMRFGLSSKYCQDRAVTAGESTWWGLKKREGQRFIFLSGLADGDLTAGLDLQEVHTVSEADFILNAMGLREENERHILKDALSHKLPMICANPDLEVQVGHQTIKCAGFYAQWYEEQGGHVEWHGKPYRPVYERAWEMLGKPDKSRICAIGDSLRTDISGAKNFGIDAVWNLDGINRDVSPEQAQGQLQGKYGLPTAIMRGFKW